jgi:hypothetical protein
MKIRDMSQWASSPLTEAEMARLSELTEKCLFEGRLGSRESAEREALRLRHIRTKDSKQGNKETHD